MNILIWKTRITEMTGTRYPIIMGAFAGHIEKTISVNEFIRNVIDSAEKIIKKKIWI